MSNQVDTDDSLEEEFTFSERIEMDLMKALNLQFDLDSDCESEWNYTAKKRKTVKSSVKRVSKPLKHNRKVVLGQYKDASSALSILENGSKFPNMTRKPKVPMLYVFPSCDKCDSLLYTFLPR